MKTAVNRLGLVSTFIDSEDAGSMFYGAARMQKPTVVLQDQRVRAELARNSELDHLRVVARRYDANTTKKSARSTLVA
ncbi:hypothetical protein AS156_29300 [Bradyrhizobium macuxiense]|uniref:Uncharacterized protein n=1 Tax=Bradyrhizobium macuxiense TaxID=1755647 RepID=A0A109K461_9BRAD|nr:hypothetical protein AS156_29300 [Bradyrhizobium macuxiense]